MSQFIWATRLPQAERLRKRRRKFTLATAGAATGLIAATTALAFDLTGVLSATPLQRMTNSPDWWNDAPQDMSDAGVVGFSYGALEGAYNRMGYSAVRWSLSGSGTRLSRTPAAEITDQLALAVNASGQAAGWAIVVTQWCTSPSGNYPCNSVQRPAVWDAASEQTLLPLRVVGYDGEQSGGWAAGIADDGTVVGTIWGPSFERQQNVRWAPGAAQAVPLLSGCDVPNCVDQLHYAGAQGEVVGSRYTWAYADETGRSTSSEQPVFWPANSQTSIDIPPPAGLTPAWINDCCSPYSYSIFRTTGMSRSGLAVGVLYVDQPSVPGSLRIWRFDPRTNTTTDITPPGTDYVWPSDINDQGDIYVDLCTSTQCSSGLLVGNQFRAFNTNSPGEQFYTWGMLSNERTGAVQTVGDYYKDGYPGSRAIITVPLSAAQPATPPSASFAVATINGVEGDGVSFDVTATAGSGSALTFGWDFGDGSTLTSTRPTISHTFDDNGDYAVRVTVRNDAGVASATVTARITNKAPTATLVPPASSVDEGRSVTIALTNPVDARADLTIKRITYAFDCGDGRYAASSTTASAQCVMPDNGTRTLRATVMDEDGGATEYSARVVTRNVAPAVDAITSSTWGPVAAGSAAATVTISAPFTDPAGTLDAPYVGAVSWDVETGTSATATIVGGTKVEATKALGVGVYTVRLSVTDKVADPDKLTGSSTAKQYIVVYDATAGFVTGGGWIKSLAGYCKVAGVCEGAVGQADFGFVSKYAKGATTPTGTTEFQFDAGQLSFKSTSYQWLVVSGSRAQYKGEGTVNGRTGYSFLLTAIDGEIAGGGAMDAFRIKITETATGAIVYDNQPGATDGADVTNKLDKVNGNGSIVIHTGK